MRAILILLLFLMPPLSAYSSEYIWTTTSWSGNTYSGPSPFSACAQIPYDNQFVFDHLDRISDTQFRCVALRVSDGAIHSGMSAIRSGDSCPSGTVFNGLTGVCDPPTDGECLAKSLYTKTIQYSFADGSAVLGLDADIKDGCIYEPGEPKNCTDTQCEVEMKPVGNNVMSDNSGNPDQDLQDYLDELAKQFKCEHVANGTVGCSAAETTPPDIDPDDKCPDGYSWSGTACFPTNGGGNENPDNPTPGGDGGSSGGGSTGGSGGDGGSTGGDGSGDGSSGGGGGGNDGDDGDDKEPGVEGTACDKAFKCTGDAVNCAIAERQKNAYCENKELQDAQKGFDKIGEEIGQEKYTMLDGGDVDIGSLFGEGTRFLPSACPAVSTTTLHVGPLQFNWQPVCQYAELVGKFLVAWASLFFATYVGRAFGGD